MLKAYPFVTKLEYKLLLDHLIQKSSLGTIKYKQFNS